MIVHKHPTLLWVLCFGKAWDTFSYFGTQTILVLYVLHVFHQSQHVSYLLYGAYVVFSYALPVLGGILSDRFLGDRNALAISMMLDILGNLCLILLNQPLFCLGL